jgi:hypothetical protein
MPINCLHNINLVGVREDDLNQQRVSVWPSTSGASEPIDGHSSKRVHKRFDDKGKSERNFDAHFATPIRRAVRKGFRVGYWYNSAYASVVLKRLKPVSSLNCFSSVQKYDPTLSFLFFYSLFPAMPGFRKKSKTCFFVLVSDFLPVYLL